MARTTPCSEDQQPSNIPSSYDQRESPDRLRQEVLRQDHLKRSQIRRGQQLRKADGTGEVREFE